MVFPQYNYKEFNNTNKDKWIIKDWNKMVNDAFKYCESLNDVFEFDKYCKPTDLPSFHPYWKIQVKNNLIQLIKETEGLLSSCEKYIENDGYYKTNAMASIERYKSAITDYKNKL